MLRTTTTTRRISRQQSRAVIAKVVPYLWPSNRLDMKLRVVLAMSALILAKVTIVAAPQFLAAAVNALAPEDDALQTAYLLSAGAVGLSIAYGLVRFLSLGFDQLRDVIFARVAQHALRQLALETFRHIHALSLRYHIDRKTGALSRVIERGVKGVEFLLRFLLFSIGPLILQLIFTCIVLWWTFDITYMLVVIGIIALYIWFTYIVTEWRVKIRKEMNDKDNDANQKAIDSLLNFETVKYFAAEEREAKRYDDSMRGYESAALRTSYSLAFLNIGQGIIITVCLIVVMVMAALEVQQGRLNVGDFVLINAYIMQITMPLNFLGTVYREIRQALVDMSEMFALLHHPPEVMDAKDAKPLRVRQGEIHFDNVCFGYEAGRTILNGFTLRIKAGQTVAVVGRSGSGKSTIGRLLFRFYDVQSGAITIDGQDLRHITQDSLHQALGVIPQDTVLFNDTVGYNIAYGGQGPGHAQVVQAAKAAKIHDFIQSFPDGYDTMVGERGLKLSGGEKQRVGIARCLLKNPPILLMDEATSALDTQIERSIQTSLQELREKRSVIVITHRLSTIIDADLIVVLDKGCIIEQGTHDDLLRADGRYRAMWQAQATQKQDSE